MDLHSDQPDPILQQHQRLTPEYLISHLKGRIRNRTLLLLKLYQLHSENWVGMYLNHRLLRETVESCYCDIYRLKFFRPVEWIDSHKKAAYIMKWIAYIKPIQIRNNTIAMTKASVMANAYFGVIAGFSMLEIKEGWKGDAWWERYIGNLAYLLHHHTVSVEQLSSEMCVLKTLDDAKQS